MTDLADPLDHFLAAKKRIEAELALIETAMREGRNPLPANRLRIVQNIADWLTDRRESFERSDAATADNGDAA